MYTSYRQQYTFGQGVIDINKTTGIAASTTKYLGAVAGLQTSIANAEPIDLKAEKQMHVQKARLDFKCYEALTGTSGSATIKLMTCGESSVTANTPDTSNAVELLSIPISTANSPVASAQPWMEITMPSNTKRYVWLSITTSANPFDTGKFLIHFNPNL